MPVKTSEWSVLGALMLKEQLTLLNSKVFQITTRHIHTQHYHDVNVVTIQDTINFWTLTCNGTAFPSRECYTKWLEEFVFALGTTFQLLVGWQLDSRAGPAPLVSWHNTHLPGRRRDVIMSCYAANTTTPSPVNYCWGQHFAPSFVYLLFYWRQTVT